MSAHVSHNSGNNQWYTPGPWIDAAREVMGGIDLDPASSAIANQTVKAARYFTEEDNGLDKQWHGRVWLNPPYAAKLIGPFVEKLLESYHASDVVAAIVLVNNATETKWGQGMLENCDAICFPRGRVKFLTPDGKPGAPLQGQAAYYFGDFPEVFRRTFSKFGWVIIPRYL